MKKVICNFGESEFEFLLIILIGLCGEIVPYIGVGVGLFNKTCTVYSAAHICLSNGFFLELLLDEMEGEGVLGQSIMQVESPWMELCISYRPIWVQIGFEGLPTSTSGLFLNAWSLKAVFPPHSVLVITFRSQRASSSLRSETKFILIFSHQQLNIDISQTSINLSIYTSIYTHCERIRISQSKCNFLVTSFLFFLLSLPQPQKSTGLVKSEQFQRKNCLENELDYSIFSCNFVIKNQGSTNLLHLSSGAAHLLFSIWWYYNKSSLGPISRFRSVLLFFFPCYLLVKGGWAIST